MTVLEELEAPRYEHAGVAVLLVYGVRIPVTRVVEGVQIPGFRLTVQADGAVWVQPVGFFSQAEAERAQYWVHTECLRAGLLVERLPTPPAQLPGFVTRRRSTT